MPPRFAALIGLAVLSLLHSQTVSSDKAGTRPELHPGPTDSIRTVVFSKDGKHALSGAFDGIGRLWDVRSGKELRRLEGHTFALDAVDMTPDGRYAITSSEKTLLLWDLANGTILKRVVLPQRLINASLSANANTVFATAWGGSVLLIDLASQPEISLLGTHSVNPHSSVGARGKMTPDARWAISGGGADSNVKIWDLQARRQVGVVAGETVLSISSDGETALTGSPVRLWNLRTKRELHMFSKTRSSAAMTPDGRFAILANDDKQIELWNLQTLRQIGLIPGESVAGISSDGLSGIIVGTDSVSRLWDLRTRSPIRELAPKVDPVISIAQTPGVSRILFADFRSAHLWDKALGHEIRTLDCGRTGQGINSVALSEKGDLALLGCQGGGVKLIDLVSGNEVRTVASGISLAKVSMTGDARLAAVNAYDLAGIWDLRTGVELWRMPGQQGSSNVSSKVKSVVVSPNGQFMLGISLGRAAQLWNLQTKTQERRFELSSGRPLEQFRSVAMTPDARLALIGSSYSTARLWDLQTGKEEWTLQQGNDMNHSVDSAALTPDGAWAVTGIGGDSAQLWKVSTKKVAARFEYREQAAFTNSAIAVDGRFVTTNAGPMVRIWSSDGKSWLSLYSFPGGWAVVDDRGRYDASDPQKCPAVYGLSAGEIVPLKELTSFYTPGLMTRFLQ